MHSKFTGKLVAGLIGVTAVIASVTVQADTLRQVVQHTVKTNPEVLRSAKLKHATHEQINQARADYFPRVDLRAGIGREKALNNNTKSERGGPLTLWRRQVGLSLRQNLFRGFQTYYEVKRTSAKTDADAYAVCATAEDIALESVEAYLNVLRFNRQVGVADKNLEAHQGIFDMIKRRGESGIGREADISQATGRLALAKSNLYNIQNSQKNSKVTFMRVTGLPAHGLVMPADPANSVLPSSLDRAESLALKYHPKMRIAVIDVEELRAQHNVSHYTAFPSLDFVLEANKDLNVNGSRGRNDSYNAGLELNYNLFNGGADVARQRETAYLTQEASEVRNRTCREVKENVRLAWNNMLTTRSRLESLEQHKVSAAKTREAYDEQFRLGKRTLFDLLDAQNEAFTSELEYVNGIYDLYIAEYRVLNAIGGLNSYLRVSIPCAAHAQFNIYDERANPINVKRHFDAKLWCEDKPAVWYNREKIHHEKMSPCYNCNGYGMQGDNSGMKGMKGMASKYDNRRNRFAMKNRPIEQTKAPFNQTQQPEITASNDTPSNETPGNNTPVKTFGVNVASNKILPVRPETTTPVAQAKSAQGNKPTKDLALTRDAIDQKFAKTEKIPEQSSTAELTESQTTTEVIASAMSNTNNDVARLQETMAANDQKHAIVASVNPEITSGHHERPMTDINADQRRYHGSINTNNADTTNQTQPQPQRHFNHYNRFHHTWNQSTGGNQNAAVQSEQRNATAQNQNHHSGWGHWFHLGGNKPKAQQQSHQQAQTMQRPELPTTIKPAQAFVDQPISSRPSTPVVSRADDTINTPQNSSVISAGNTEQTNAEPQLQPQKSIESNQILTHASPVTQSQSVQKSTTSGVVATPSRMSQVSEPSIQKQKIKTQLTTRSFKPKVTGWAVQIGSFEDQDEVDELVTTLKNYGLGGYLKEIRSPTNISYEVYVGPTKTKHQAKKLVIKLRKLNIRGEVVESSQA